MNSEHKIVGIGYNGMPNKCSDDQLPWSRTNQDRLKTKYPYGELNISKDNCCCCCCCCCELISWDSFQ